MIGLDQLATVYTANGTDGAFSVAAKAGLACRLAHLPPGGGATAEERAEPVNRRRLLWGADYTMPEPAQVVVAGESGGDRWGVLGETVEGVRGPDGGVVYRRAMVVRVMG